MSYWETITQQRISRRRALAATGAAAAGAAFLAACGGDSKSDGGDASGVIAKIEDSTKQAKRGGTHKSYLALEPGNFDPNLEGGPIKDHTYSQLMMAATGYKEPQALKDYEAGLAMSWEWSPDLLTLTMKLRPGVKWHNKPPVNGRALDTQDLLVSWERFLKVGRQRGALSNTINPDAPITSLTAPDANTIVWKLKEPLISLLAIFTSTAGGLYVVMPKETDTTYDSRTDIIGNGPFYLSKYEPSSGVTLKRAPDHWDKERPYIDTLEMPYVSEYATRLAQFKAGNIYSLTPKNNDIRSEDIIPLKRDVPAVNIYHIPVSADFENRCIAFGWQGGSPFLDERVRQAVSMSLDRDLWLDIFGNVSTFAKEGVEVQTAWNSNLGHGSAFWHIDPKDAKNFGPNAKFFQYDVAEAKKLLAAAGHPSGLDVGSSKWATNWGEKETEVLDGMALAAGFKTTRSMMDRSLEYPKFRDGNGKWEKAWAYIGGGSLAPEAVAFATFRYSTKGGVGFAGFDGAGKGDASGDPTLEALIKKASLEVDDNRRQAIIHDVQRYLGGKMYNITSPGSFSTFSPAWPALKNYLVFQGNARWENNEYWIDESLPPFKQA